LIYIYYKIVNFFIHLSLRHRSPAQPRSSHFPSFLVFFCTRLVCQFGRRFDPVQRHCLRKTTQRKHTYVTAPSGIRSHDPGVRAV